MPKAWKEVEQSDNFKSLPFLEKVQAQQSYFNEVVAPQVPPEEIQKARSEFLSKYTYSPEKLRGAAESLNISDVTGIKPEDIDTSTGGDFFDRVDYSASDTDEEVVNKFSTKYPEGSMFRVAIPRKNVLGRLIQPDARLIFKYDNQDEKEKWKTVEDLGVSFSDVGDLAAPAAKAAVTIAGGAATGGSSIVTQMLAYGGAAAGAHLIKEGIEELRGTQLQPVGDVLEQAGMEGAITAGMAGAGAAITKGLNIATGAGALGQHPEIAKLLKDINKAKKAGLTTESLMVHQKTPENMIISRLGAQAESTSKSAQHRLITQKASAFNALIEQQGSQSLAGKRKILGLVRKTYNKEINNLKNQFGRITPRQTDRAIAEGMDDFVRSSKVKVSLKYNAADDAAARENPTFDLTPAQDKGSQIHSLVLGEAQDIAKKVEVPGISIKGTQITKPRQKTVVMQPLPINVANTPEGQLIGVINDLNKLKPDQANYEVIKQLRTRTGNIIETWPWEASVNKGQAKSLYSSLTRVLENPTNKSPAFVKAHSEASASAKARYDFLDAVPIRQMIKMEPSGKLIQQLSKPNALTDVHMKLFNDKSFPKEKLSSIKQGIKGQIVLDENGAIQAIQKYRMDDPEAWRFLVKKNEEKTIYSIANDIDKLNGSNIGQVINSGTKVTAILDDLLLKKGTTRGDVLDVAKSLGPQGKEQLRFAIYDDIINKTQVTLKGSLTVDKNALGKVIKDYKDFGIWDSPILTKSDRSKLQGLKSYLDLIFFRGTDPGVSLEAAQAITNLKHPLTFMKGVHQLTVNSLTAKFLSSKIADKLIVGRGKDYFSSRPLIKTGIIMKGLLEGTEPGDESMTPIEQ